MFSPTTHDIENVRLAALEVGHDAKRAAAYIPNPNIPGTVLWMAWQDGYDLGVLTAKIDMTAEEKIVDISAFRC